MDREWLTGRVQTNCLTEICFDDAIDQARHLDNFQRTHGRLIGPLHGVPMSVKDQFNIKGLDSTLGYVCNAFTPAKSDALLVHTLKQLGAIIIAKTNLPQSIMVKQALQIWDSIGFTDWTSGVRLTTRYGV